MTERDSSLASSGTRVVIALLTDFGASDVYVGVMKGVIAGIAPDARVIDLCHEVPPQGVLSGAYLLGAAYPFLPEGAIVVVVVDPGVGSARRIVAVRAAGRTFVAPDNGVLSAVLMREEVGRAVAVENRELFAREVSSTFHGRDIFAPVAAHLAAGIAFGELGPFVDSATLERGEAARLLAGAEPGAAGGLRGAVLHVDRFGNVITNVSGDRASEIEAVVIGGVRVEGVVRTYAEVEPGEVLALVGSTGLLELSVRDGSAQRLCGAGPGDSVEVELAS